MKTVRRPGENAGCDARLINRLLEVMENELVPVTRREVKKGNKIFGAAILRKDDLSTVIVGVNNETSASASPWRLSSGKGSNSCSAATVP